MLTNMFPEKEEVDAVFFRGNDDEINVEEEKQIP